MPSHLHEALVELFRVRPDLAAELLTGPLGVTLPRHDTAALEPAELAELMPTEYRADAVVALRADGSAVWAVVVEVQLRRDPDKRWSWPAYVATLRARLRCPVSLLVVCPDRAAAAWCAEPIELGHAGSVLTPLVLGPDLVPAVTDPVRAAAQSPELAVLGAIAHGARQPGVLDALLVAFSAIEPDRATLYLDIVLDALPAAARAHLEALVTTGTYEYRSDFARRYFSRGKAEGEARAILAVLAARGVDVPEATRARIAGCADLDQLDRWVRRAAVAVRVDELFTDDT